ncbi:MAG: hypothetical protein V2A73_16880 [Pseudomonadota bacterium]
MRRRLEQAPAIRQALVEALVVLVDQLSDPERALLAGRLQDGHTNDNLASMTGDSLRTERSETWRGENYRSPGLSPSVSGMDRDSEIGTVSTENAYLTHLRARLRQRRQRRGSAGSTPARRAQP